MRFGSISVSYTHLEVCRDFIINVLMASVMGVIVFEIGKVLTLPSFIILGLQIMVGAIVYIFLSILTHASSFTEIKMMAGKYFLKYKRD